MGTETTDTTATGTADTGAEAPRATRREWIGLAVIALACVLYVMDLTVLHLAVPQMTEDLRPSSTELLWIIDIYGFMIAGALVTMGTLGDRIGRRRLLLIGAAAFGVASVAAAFSTSPAMLIATRALLGLAGATLAPSTLSLIRNMFLDERQRTVAVSIWITSFSVGGVIGPLLGGLVLEFFWWGAVFLLAVPVMALLLVLGPKLLPEYRDPDAGRLDVVSAGMSLVAILAAVLGLKQFAQHGIGWLPLASVLAGVVVGIAFVRRESGLDDPLIDLRLFRAPGFGAALATYGLGVAVAFGGFLFLPQYLQLVLGLSPLEAGVWTLPWAVGFVVGSQVTPRLARRVPAVALMAGGMALAGLGFAAFVLVDETSGYPVFLLGSLLFSLGLAPVVTLAIDLIIGVAPPERAGAASGVAETGAELGGAVGIAVFGSIGAAVYRSAMAADVPSGVPAGAALEARDTLGAAVEVAAGLPGRLGPELLEAAQAAYIDGMHLVTAISAVGALVLAVFVALGLRGVGGDSEPETRADPAGDVELAPSTAA